MRTVPGPNGPISLTRDSLGYPSLCATSLNDGLYALGFMHATDRLTQITFAVLAARGQLMSVLGDKPLPRLIDRSCRTVGLTRDLVQQVQACSAESQALMQAYAAGFNAGAEARGTPLLLRALGVPKLVCTPESMVAVFRFVTYFGLTSMQLSSELIVADLIAHGAPQRVFERLLGKVGEGLDLESLSGLTLPEELSFFTASFGSTAAGSNAFAVTSGRSKSGGALLMGEFHMEVGRFPPLLYPAHIEYGPGEYVTGVTIPGVPWFGAARTRNVGWSYTFAHADNVDFLVERVKDGAYLAGDVYQPFRVREERVLVRGRPTETWTYYENDYGTLLGDAHSEGDRPCLRLSGMSETHRAFSAGHRVFGCQNVEQLCEVQREVRNVSLEAVMVDRHGAIASVVTGQVDERPAGWTGAYPRKGWDLASRNPGVIGEELRPVAVNPKAGVIVSANQGGQGDNVAHFCTFPEAPYRAQRIGEMLAAQPLHDIASLTAISYDPFDASARRLLPVWGPLLPQHPLAGRLVKWATTQADKELLYLFHRLYEEVCMQLLEQDLPRAMVERFREWSALALYQTHMDALLALERPDMLSETELRDLLQRAFTVCLTAPLNPSVPVRLRFKHPVTQGKTPALFGFDSPTVELPGSPVTPFQSRQYPMSGETLVHAPAFHLVFDMSTEGARYNMPGGASESRFGPGYGKGLSEWLNGEMLPFGRQP